MDRSTHHALFLADSGDFLVHLVLLTPEFAELIRPEVVGGITETLEHVTETLYRSGFPDPAFHDDPRAPSGTGQLFAGGKGVFRIVGKADTEAVRRPEGLGKDRPDPLRPGGRKELRGIGK